MDPLPYPDNFYFDAAEGWLMLGNARSALDELRRLRPETRALPTVLEMEWSAEALLQSWDAAFQVAQRLVGVAPDRPAGWIHRAYSARRMSGGSLELAWESLRPAFDQFPREEVIPYNLACYAAQLGRLDEAWEWLSRASKAAGNTTAIKSRALMDDDLRPLWKRLSQETP